MHSYLLESVHVQERHTAENTAKYLQEVLESYKLDRSDFQLYTTDMGANIKKAIR